MAFIIKLYRCLHNCKDKAYIEHFGHIVQQIMEMVIFRLTYLTENNIS